MKPRAMTVRQSSSITPNPIHGLAIEPDPDGRGDDIGCAVDRSHDPGGLALLGAADRKRCPGGETRPEQAEAERGHGEPECDGMEVACNRENADAD